MTIIYTDKSGINGKIDIIIFIKMFGWQSYLSKTKKAIIYVIKIIRIHMTFDIILDYITG